MIPSRESMLLPAVGEYFQDQYCKLVPEVQFYDHRIDLYGYSPVADCCIAVELKLRNWQRALQQALLYQLCSDYVYIAVPESTARRVDVEALREHGIGLLSISENRCIEELPAVASTVINSNYKAVYTAMMQR